MRKYLQSLVTSAAPILLAATLHAAPAKLPIPMAKLPSPNGYDLLIQAGHSFKLGNPGSPSSSEKLSPAEDLKRQRAYTTKNAAALRLMQQALQLPIVSPPSRGYENRFPDYAKLRELARLGVQQSRVLYADRQQDRAVQSALDVVQVGAATQNGANIVGMLVGSAVQGIGRRDLWTWRTECDSATALRAARRLEAIEASTPLYTAIVQEEKWTVLSGIQATLASPEWKKFRRGDSKELSKTIENPREIARLRRFSDSQIQSNLALTLDKIIAQSRLPYSRSLPAIAPAADPLSEMSVSPNQNLAFRMQYERIRVTNRLLMTSFALQAFKRERGIYPNSLSELRPKYLQAVPLDSFARNAPLSYKRNALDFTLYSVGPDGVDNGGTPIKGRVISPESLGDMVADSSL